MARFAHARGPLTGDLDVMLLRSLFDRGRYIRGRSRLSTFMKAYTAYARGEGVWDHRTLFPENQHLILITDNVL